MIPLLITEEIQALRSAQIPGRLNTARGPFVSGRTASQSSRSSEVDARWGMHLPKFAIRVSESTSGVAKGTRHVDSLLVRGTRLLQLALTET